MTPGFENPNHTQVPNDLFDIYMCDMTESELRVVLAIIRKTKGWHKVEDRISLSELMKMTGMSRTGVVDGANGLIEKGLIEKVSKSGGTNMYRLLVTVGDPPDYMTSSPSRLVKGPTSSPKLPGLVAQGYPQKKEKENSIPSRAEKENSARGQWLWRGDDMTPEQHEECLAYLNELSEDEINGLMSKYPILAGLVRDGKPWLDEWAYWVGEILPQEEERQNVLSMPVEDLSAVQHFQDEDVIRVVRAFHRLWGVPIPTSSKPDKSRVKDWSNGARQILSVCDGHDVVQVMEAFKQWRDQVDPEMEIVFPRPSSLVNMIGSFIPKYKPASTQPTEYDKHGLPILR